MLDEDKILILDKKKEDITSKVIKQEEDTYFIQYKKGDKIYKYKAESLYIYKNPTVLNQCIIRTSTKTLSNVDKVLVFLDYLKVFFKNGSNKLYSRDQLIIEKDLLDNPSNRKFFNYLREMANTLTIKDIHNENVEEGKNTKLLKGIYEKITNISEQSIANSFFTSENHNNTEKQDSFLYPFSFNISQQEAIKNAFNNNISVIEGPPGTGKTQTILNIIANAILDNKTVAVLSNNNNATDNVYDKLNKEGLGFIAAKLGKEKNLEKFIAEQGNIKKSEKSWYLNDQQRYSILKTIVSMNEDINNYLEEKNNIAQLKQELENIKLEQKYYLANHPTNVKHIQIPNFNADELHHYFLYLNKQENKNLFFNNKVRLVSYVKYKFFEPELYHNSIMDILDTLKYHFYYRKIIELEAEIDQKENNLKELKLEETFKEYTKLSMKVYKSFLYESYSNQNTYTNLKQIRDTPEFIKDYPIILSTTYSLLNCVSPNFMFDYMIVDESSQVDLVSAFAAICLTKNLIVVGDSKQLPNIIDNDRKMEFNSIFEKYKLAEKYNYTKNNLLSLTKELYPNMPIKVLREHYRCHPKIIQFCNQRFYDNELIILSDNTEPNPIKLYKSVKGNHARKDETGSQFNDRQAQIIIKEIFPNENIDITKDSVGIIAPYTAQKKYLRSKIESDKISIDTVHGFQGQERDTIIFSTVANNITKFLDNPNSINVAVSRAVNKLFLVTPYEYKSKQNSNISCLMNYIHYQNFEVIQSKINSIYDLLYKDNTSKRLEFLKNHIPFSKYPSETITYHTILKILQNEKYKMYSVKKSVYPLKEIVKDLSILTKEEQAFVNTNSHLDFIIYYQFNKQPALAIEVDGYKFHKTKAQKIRDAKKNSILAKCNIPLLRLQTNECLEEERIIAMLDEIIEKSAD